jgi:hypothetical protein
MVLRYNKQRAPETIDETRLFLLSKYEDKILFHEKQLDIYRSRYEELKPLNLEEWIKPQITKLTNLMESLGFDPTTNENIKKHQHSFS